MLKRVLLAFAFVAALGAGGLGMSSKALAWHCDDDYGYGGYGGYRTYYPSDYGYDYSPRVSYYRSYPAYYRDYRFDDDYRHHHHHHSGLSVSFGF